MRTQLLEKNKRFDLMREIQELEIKQNMLFNKIDSKKRILKNSELISVKSKQDKLVVFSSD